MTTSPTPAERLALKTAHAALESRDASYDLVSTIVFALGSAGLLMDPETAEELRQLRASCPVDEDPIAFTLTAQAEALHASSGAVIETTTETSVDPNGCGWCGIPKEKHGRQWTAAAGWHPWNRPTQEQIKERMRRRRSVAELRGLLARQTEDPHDGELHHPYRLGRDFPESGVRP